MCLLLLSLQVSVCLCVLSLMIIPSLEWQQSHGYNFVCNRPLGSGRQGTIEFSTCSWAFRQCPVLYRCLTVWWMVLTGSTLKAEGDMEDGDV